MFEKILGREALMLKFGTTCRQGKEVVYPLFIVFFFWRGWGTGARSRILWRERERTLVVV